MAQNDYFVIVYRVLKYLYDCLKKGEKPEARVFSCIDVQYSRKLLDIHSFKLD